MNHQDPEISVVIPVYNNAGTLKELYRRLCKVFESIAFSYEMIFVNDASSDESSNVLKDLAKQDLCVKPFVFKYNSGQQRAVFFGLKHARGKWIITMDADLQDPPEAIPEILSKIQENYNAVFAGRRGRYESSFRLLTSRLFKWIIHLITGVPSDAGMFLAMTKQMKSCILDFQGPPFLVVMLGCTGLPVVSIPVERSRRNDGRSAYSHAARLKISLSAILWAFLWKWRCPNKCPTKAEVLCNRVN